MKDVDTLIRNSQLTSEAFYLKGLIHLKLRIFLK